MADPISLASVNPFGKFQVGGMGLLANILLVVIIAVLFIGVAAALIWFFTVKKQYYIKIHLFRLVGNNPTRVAVLRAKEVAFGRAGDRLWRVAPSGLSMAFKVLKWIPVGKLQTAANEFWYWVREDGEWINFTPSDIDSKSHKMDIKFVQEDMRLQRLATDRLLEQRLLNKSFWEKYGMIVGYVIFFLVITICMVIIFYQFSSIADKVNLILSKAASISKEGGGSLIPS